MLFLETIITVINFGQFSNDIVLHSQFLFDNCAS